NYIGTDVTGTIGIGNNVGVYIIQAAGGNIIGGSAPGSANLISGNFQGGIILSTNGNKVQGNVIGTKADGVTRLANTYAGVQVVDGHDNFIGGTGAGEGNIIYSKGFVNGGYGVRIDKGANNVHNAILGNSIYANDGLGIDLGGDGVTANDPDTGIPGPQTANANQNYPVLTAVNPNGNNTDVIGSLNSIPNTQFRLEFFSSPLADASGFGEGKTFLGFLNVTTAGSGNVPSFTFTVPTASLVGNYVTATATDPANNTSEFSNAKPNAAIGTLQFSSATYSVNENGGSATITVTR